MSRRLAVALFLAATLACSPPPDNELHQAQGAIAAARAADAATYAPDELRAAETALTEYDAAVGQRDYKLALRLALEARDSAYQAAKQAGDSKAATRSEAERLVAEVTALIERASASAGNKTSSATSRIRPDTTAATSALQEARAALERQQYREVRDALRPIAARLRSDLPEPAPSPSRRDR
jgi:hypothetical protein